MEPTNRKNPEPGALHEDALHRVISLEHQTQGALRDAEDEARAILDNARTRVETIRAKSEAKIASETERLTVESERSVETDRETVLREAVEGAEAWTRRAESKFSETLDLVLGIVTMQRSETE